MRALNIRVFITAILAFILGLSMTGCGSSKDDEKSSAPHQFQAGPDTGQGSFKILAGSEQKELEPLFTDIANKNNINLRIDYKGSLDIMQTLKDGAHDYDALMPASSLWLTMGDDKKLMKHVKTTSISPVVFGITTKKADELGWKGHTVPMNKLMDAVSSKKLSFAMTSATQSNSGASAYLGFLTALANDKNGLSKKDLDDRETQKKITTLLSGINRSSGSSNWLTDMFVGAHGKYDAMVNYEAMIIKANKELKAQGQDTLKTFSPEGGLTLSDSPFGYVDHGDADKEKAFESIQQALLSPHGQSEIEKTGKRNAFGQVSDENKHIFTDQGIDLSQILTTITTPAKDVIFAALDKYQTLFRKPSYTIYVLDYSGSMAGQRHEQMLDALGQVMVPQRAQESMLKGTDRDKTVALPFSGKVDKPLRADGNGEKLEGLYKRLEAKDLGGGTHLYEAVDEAVRLINNENPQTLSEYTPAIVVLTDGQDNGSMGVSGLRDDYRASGSDVPIFTIQFGDADKSELEEIAGMSNGKVFDGTHNLTESFKEVRGYN